MTALRIDRPVLVRALVLALSAWVAFAIATLVHVQNAYWAAMPVWVVAQASRGVLLERALFRVVGTLLGAAVGFAILHVPVDPYVQFALLGLWVAVNGGLTHVLRGVHGYGALLAGITAAIVVVPSVLAPGASLELATARVECTLIGVLVGFDHGRARDAVQARHHLGLDQLAIPQIARALEWVKITGASLVSVAGFPPEARKAVKLFIPGRPGLILSVTPKSSAWVVVV